MSQSEILITKKNKKGKIVESDIRPMIRNFDLLDIQDNMLILEATIATGSKANLNTNIFIPKILDLLELEMDPLDVDILRRDLYKITRWSISISYVKKSGLNHSFFIIIRYITI